jgi:methylated-DNA-[protein]-cysteine S-methyltransferase
MILFSVIQTEMGWLGIAGESGVLDALVLPGLDRYEISARMQADLGRTLFYTDADFSGEADRLRAYFAGERVNFRCAVRGIGTTEFDHEVWDGARRIPYGETWTYGELAAMIGHPGAARAVGSALGRNPVPVVVPCHRIIRSDGGLGGFSAGIHWKISLLALEGSPVEQGNRTRG